MAVLGVLLVGVLGWQFTRKGPGGGSSKKGDTATTRTAKGSNAKSASSSASGGVAFKKSDVDIDDLVASVRDRVFIDFVYEDERVARDPMRALVQEGATGPMWQPKGLDVEREMIIRAIRDKVVSGIVWDETNPCAVIDNEVVRRWHQFPLGIVLVDIQPDFVTFGRGDIELPIGLKEW